MSNVDPTPMSDAELGAAIRSYVARVHDFEIAIEGAQANLDALHEQHQAQLADAEASFAAAKSKVQARAVAAYQAVIAQLDDARKRIDDAAAAAAAQEQAIAEQIETARRAVEDAKLAQATLLDDLQMI